MLKRDRTMNIRNDAVALIPRELIKDKRISVNERSLLITICLADKGEGITIEDLCIHEGRTKRTIRKYIKNLIACGYLVKTENGYEATI